MSDTIRALLALGADDATALIAPDGAALDYRGLRVVVDSLGRELTSYGVGARDRVAISVPNGPIAAIAFLACASRAAAAPLNPKYRESEFEFYLQDLNPRLLIVAADSGDAVLAAAATVGVTVATISGTVGELTLGRKSDEDVEDWPAVADAGLLLHTSGTTSRPKVVPISQRNLAQSASNIAKSLALTAADRSLNVMPLFHIHGLMAGLLAPLSVGATVVATAGFDAFAFFNQLATFAPTYYTAVPTMHQMVIDRGQKRPEAAAAKLRFIRSSSASLPSSVLEQLEALFGAPVIEAYGMTEATHQMCANPLPPGQRKSRSVGVPTGIELSVVDETGASVAAGSTGQVAIKGATVVASYQDNPEATKDAFRGGWFLTGDEGYLDQDGYLYLTGRLKELINRGGEKISPLEVDEALLRHPSVAQAVTFAVAHKKLGEDVAAGVVLRPDAKVSERELKDFLSLSLAAFKVPRSIVFLDELPKGATGKLQRIGLAERLGIGPWDLEAMMTTSWVRFLHGKANDRVVAIGSVTDGVIGVHSGDLFADPQPTGETLAIESVELLTPTQPTKMIGLWNNFVAAALKNKWEQPSEPLWFIKPSSCFLRPGGIIEPPSSYDGRVFFEGELGIVIGGEGRIFGYTCVNDVTAFGLLTADPSFPQWCRAKSLNTFGPFGPVVVTDLDPSTLTVRTTVDGRERQNYPVSDMIFGPAELVDLISRDMTLYPGDVIACGTSTGAMPMQPGNVVEVAIDDIGTLRNAYGRGDDRAR